MNRPRFSSSGFDVWDKGVYGLNGRRKNSEPPFWPAGVIQGGVQTKKKERTLVDSSASVDNVKRDCFKVGVVVFIT